MSELVIHNARVLTCDPARPGLGMIDHGAIAIADGAIRWVGDDAERPHGDRALDAGGRLVTPGLVDCHTHAIFAGDRAGEFGMRAAGKSYLEIAKAGGGIAASLGPTRAATDAALIAALTERLDTALAGGTTTIEVKSGYDLTLEGELRLLRCIAAAAARRTQRVVPTLLAHLVPPERSATRDGFVTELCDQLIPRVVQGRLASSVDAYCDEGAFTLAESRAIFTAARAAGLAVRGHAGQFRDLGAAELLGELSGLSADHVEQISDAGIAALAGAGTVAVMLPGACVQLRLPVPPVDRLRRAGVAMAIASDLNPGSSYCETLPIQMWLATTYFGMTIEETWLGVTRHAARALGAVGVGTITRGTRADLLVWACDDPAYVPYRYGAATQLIETIFVAGEHLTEVRAPLASDTETR
ncbi:MAG TPA: imidazolonepropionase [Kofleriaceae bacterium]|nr:imidazolonepropionase [Kofleriaceae bacterium]